MSETIKNSMTQIIEWLKEFNDTTEVDGKKLFAGGVIPEHQRPVRTPVIIVELPEVTKATHLNLGGTHSDMKYRVHLQVGVQGTDPMASCILADDLCKILRWKIKEAAYQNEFDGINDIKHGDCQFYGLERADQGSNLLLIVARQAMEYTVEEQYEEVGPLVASAHLRLRNWIDSETIIETIDGTPVPEPEEEEPEEGEE